MEDDFPADGPGELPDFLCHAPLFLAPLGNDPDKLLHSDPHYHLLVLESLLSGSGGVFEAVPQPLLNFLDGRAVSELVFELAGGVVAGFGNVGEASDQIVLEQIDLPPDLLGDLEVDLGGGKLGDLVEDGPRFELAEGLRLESVVGAPVLDAVETEADIELDLGGGLLGVEGLQGRGEAVVLPQQLLLGVGDFHLLYILFACAIYSIRMEYCDAQPVTTLGSVTALKGGRSLK